jgi:hypothetical protein
MILTVLTIFLTLSFCDPPAQVAIKHEWKYVGISYGPHGERDEMYYDAGNIEHTPDGFTRAPLKGLGIYQNEEEKQKRFQELMRNREINGFPLKGYDRYAYSVMTVEFDCKKSLRRYPCIADYDESEKRIGGECLEELKWEKIPGESLAKKVFDAVCKAK